MEDSSKSVEKDDKEKSHQQEGTSDKKPEDGLGAENSGKDEEKDNSKVDKDYDELPKFKRKKKFSGFTAEHDCSTEINNEQSHENDNHFQNKVKQQEKNKKTNDITPAL